MGAPGTDLTGWRWLRGRAGRLEYWAWTAVLLLIGVRISLSGAPPLFEFVGGWLALFVQIRRLHDLGISGWWVLGLMLAQLAGYAVAAAIYLDETAAGWGATLVLLVALAILGLVPGQREANRFGPPPGRPSLKTLFG